MKERQTINMDVQRFWRSVLMQDEAAIRAFFHADAWVEWPCSNERFSLSEYLRANCEYPGAWDGEVERVVETPEGVITAAHVFSKDGSASFHVVSFLHLREGRIAAMTEYWGDDAPAPAWRQQMNIGSAITK